MFRITTHLCVKHLKQFRRIKYAYQHGAGLSLVSKYLKHGNSFESLKNIKCYVCIAGENILDWVIEETQRMIEIEDVLNSKKPNQKPPAK